MHLRSKYVSVVVILFLIPILLSTTSVMAGTLQNTIIMNTVYDDDASPQSNIVKVVNLPPKITKTYTIYGDGATVIIRGRTTISFNNFIWNVGISIRNPAKVVFDNVVVNVDKICPRYSPFIVVSIYGSSPYGVSGNYLYINMSPKVKIVDRYNNKVFEALKIKNARSVSFGTLKINMNVPLDTGGKTSYMLRQTALEILPAYLENSKSHISIDKLIITAKSSVNDMQTKFYVTQTMVKIGGRFLIWDFAGLKSSVIFAKNIKPNADAVIKSLLVQDSGAKNIKNADTLIVNTYNTELTINLLSVRNINYVVNRHYSRESRMDFAILDARFSSVRIRRLFAYDIIGDAYRGYISIFGDLIYAKVKYGLIITRNFGVGNTYSTGGILRTYILDVDESRGKDGIIKIPEPRIGLQMPISIHHSLASIDHIVLKNTPANVGIKGVKELKGKVLVVGKGTGYLWIDPIKREHGPLRIPVKNHRITIILDEKYKGKKLAFPTLLTSPSMISMSVSGEHIKVIIDGKTYYARTVYLCVPQGMVRSLVRAIDGSGHRISAITRPGLISGIYSGTMMGG